MASIKVQYQNELRRLSSTSTSSSAESWSSLEQRISQLLSLPVGQFTVKYTDEDGDLITLSTDAELADLLLVNNNKAQSIRLQVFPKNPSSLPTPVPSVPSASTETLPVPAPTPVSEPEVRREFKEEKEPELNEEEEQEDSEEEEEDSEDEEEAVASQEDKGKEPVDENKPAEEAGKEKEKEEPKPSLKEIHERAEKLGQHIQDVLNQHPEIEEEIEAIKELFAEFVVHQIKERQRQQEEIRQRHREILAARFAHFFGGHPAFSFHQQQQQQPESQQQEQQQRCQERCQKAREEAARSSSSSRCGAGFRQEGGCQPRQFCFVQRGAEEAPRRHPFAQAFEEKLSILENMGFIDRELNVFLLRKHRGSLEAIIQELSEIHSQF